MRFSAIVENRPPQPGSKRQAALATKRVVRSFALGPYRIIEFKGPEAVNALITYSRGTNLCTKYREKAEKHLASGPLYLCLLGSERLVLADSQFYEVSYTDDIPIQDAGLTSEVAELLRLVRAAGLGGARAARNIDVFLAGGNPFE